MERRNGVVGFMVLYSAEDRRGQDKLTTSDRTTKVSGAAQPEEGEEGLLEWAAFFKVSLTLFDQSKAMGGSKRRGGNFVAGFGGVRGPEKRSRSVI